MVPGRANQLLVSSVASSSVALQDPLSLLVVYPGLASVLFAYLAVIKMKVEDGRPIVLVFFKPCLFSRYAPDEFNDLTAVGGNELLMEQTQSPMDDASVTNPTCQINTESGDKGRFGFLPQVSCPMISDDIGSSESAIAQETSVLPVLKT